MNGITYTRQGDYNLPNLLPPQEPEAPSGKYALLRKKFLKEHRRITYTNLLTSGQLSSHLAEIEQTAQRQMEQMVTQMAKENGVTEEQMAKCIAKECACTPRCKCSGNLPDQSDNEAYEMTLE